MQETNLYILSETNWQSLISSSLMEAIDTSIRTHDDRLAVVREVASKNICVECGAVSVTASASTARARININLYGFPFLQCSISKTGSIYIFNENYFGKEAVSRAEGLRNESLYLLVLGLLIDNGKLRVKKRIRESFGFETCIYTDFPGVKIKHLLLDKGENWLFEQKSNSWRVFCVFHRKQTDIPSSMYPMPNTENIPRIFTRANSCVLDDKDELASILDKAGIKARLGHCYSNAENIIAALHDARYDRSHTVEYYGGWVCDHISGIWLHHAWVVVDQRSVIDMTNPASGPILEMEKSLKEGNARKYDRSYLANELRRYEQKNLSFRDRYQYGDCGTWCYVGVPTSSEEAKTSYSQLMQKFPHHPSYQNINKETGKNQLQEAYYAQTKIF